MSTSVSGWASWGRIVYTAFATLYHYKSVSKGEVILSELGRFNERWSDVPGMDPSYNVNLSQSSPNAITLRSTLGTIELA